MTSIHFDPLPNGLFRITGGAAFEAAWTLAQQHTAAGKFREACQVRFEACGRLLESLPDDDEVPPLDFEKQENRYPLFLLHASAIDHLLIGDYDTAAALLETLLDLDEEDHLEATQTLAWCYLALDEPESYAALRPDLDEKSAEKALAEIWAELRFERRTPVEKIANFREKFPAVFREFVAADHPADAAWLAEIDGPRPSPEARARRIWLQTESLWQQFPELIVLLKQYA